MTTFEACLTPSVLLFFPSDPSYLSPQFFYSFPLTHLTCPLSSFILSLWPILPVPSVLLFFPSDPSHLSPQFFYSFPLTHLPYPPRFFCSFPLTHLTCPLSSLFLSLWPILPVPLLCFSGHLSFCSRILPKHELALLPQLLALYSTKHEMKKNKLKGFHSLSFTNSVSRAAHVWLS